MIRPSALLLFLTCLAPHSLPAQDLNPLTLEFLVNQTISNSQTYPHVASDEDGGYVIAWSNFTLSNITIRLRRYGPDHQPLSDEIQIATGLHNTNRAYVHYWKEGRYVIVWTTSVAPGNSSVRVLNADNTLEDTFVMGVPHDHDMDIRDDEMVVAYTSNAHIRLRKWDLLTNDWSGTAVQASEATSANYQLPQVRWTSTGGIVAVYRGNSPSPHHIYRKTFNANLLAQAPEASVYSVIELGT